MGNFAHCFSNLILSISRMCCWHLLEWVIIVHINSN